MGDTSIRVSDEAKARLDRYKREGESYDDVIVRLTSTDRWAGFGVLAESEQSTREGMARMRDRMRAGTSADILTTRGRSGVSGRSDERERPGERE